jgi:hypothetical protein
MKTSAIIVGVALLIMTGCSSPGILVARQEADALPKMGKAPEDGNYGLFIAGQSQELLEFPLKKDDPIGFDRGEDGVVRWLYAVAGNAKNRLDVTQTYEWRRQP